MSRLENTKRSKGLGDFRKDVQGREAVTNLYMERNKMNVRHIVVAVSAAAILAGSSFGALAGGYHKKAYSKGESESSVISVGTFKYGQPLAITLQHQENSAFTNQHNGGAGAEAETGGGALAAQGAIMTHHFAAQGAVVAAWGSTYGSSCAGSGCN